MFRALVLAVIVCFSAACQPELENTPSATRPVTVGFYAGEPSTRTTMLSNGLSAAWEVSDEIALWARNSSGNYTLSAHTFRTYGLDSSRGWFTATLDSAMPEDNYTYYASYPVPQSVSGNNARFLLSDVQDGKAGEGCDILLSGPCEHGALTPVPEVEDHSGMSLRMSHILHQFRFYVPAGQDKLDGETIEKMVLTFPENVVGTVVADFTDPEAALSLENGSPKVTLKLAEPLKVSTDAAREYACVALMPQTFAADQSFTLKAYSATKVATADAIDLQGRTFLAGHSTPVKILLTDVRNYCRIHIKVVANHLGEDVDTITLTAPEGCRWGDAGSNVLVFTPEGATEGSELEISFEEEEYYRAFSGKSISVNYDSEHVNTTVTYTMPDMSSSYTAQMSLEVPYLLYEDFSTVESFSSSDGYSGGSNAGSKSAYSFLNGWTGGRIGAEAGKCIRIASRRETSSRYGARVDSAPIIALKKTADINVHFDYGINSQFGGVAIIVDGDVGEDVYIGYVTTTSGLSSGSEEGTFEDDNHINAHEFTGTYDNVPYDRDCVIHDAPTGTVRISWRNMSESRAGTTNTTNWFYLDNVKVSIAK